MFVCFPMDKKKHAEHVLQGGQFTNMESSTHSVMAAYMNQLVSACVNVVTNRRGDVSMAYVNE